MNKYESLLKFFWSIFSPHVVGLLKINKTSREVDTVKTVSPDTSLKIKSVLEIAVNVFVKAGLCLRARVSGWLEPSMEEPCQADWNEGLSSRDSLGLFITVSALTD